MNKMLIGLLAGILTVTAQAEISLSGSIQASIKAENIVTGYSGDGTEYKTSDVAGQAIVSIKGSGDLAELESTEVQNLSENLPDEAAGEFDKIKFERVTDKTAIMTMDSSSNVDDSTPFRSTHSVEVQLQSGTWADLDNGATLQLKATKRGERQLKEAKKVMGELLKLKLKAQLEAQGISSSISAKIKASSGETMTISKDRLVIPQDKIEVAARMTIRIR